MKFLYPVKKLNIKSWIKYWILKKANHGLTLLDGNQTVNDLSVSIKNGIITINGTPSASCVFKITNGLIGKNGTPIPNEWYDEEAISNILNKTLKITYISGIAPTRSCALRFYSQNNMDQFYFLQQNQEKEYTIETNLGRDRKINFITIFSNGNIRFENYKFKIEVK